MPCTVVVGGQYGSEGKGKVAALIAARSHAPWVIRCGGPNSGHSTSIGGNEVVVRQLPAGIGHPSATALVPAGAVVDEIVLSEEIRRFGVVKDRIVVDPRAILLVDKDREWEELNLRHISSTCSGTGAAQIRRISRAPNMKLAGASAHLREYVRIEPVAPLVHDCLDRGGDVILEGTQGFGLSLLHGLEYPFVTSRDTTASGVISDVGLSPRQINFILLVLRTYPIRTGENGPLPSEITWEEVQQNAGASSPQHEFASVTRRPRRVGKFDIGAVKIACLYNRPTALAVMGLDRLDVRNSAVRDFSLLTCAARAFIRDLEEETKVPVILVGTGFRSDEAIWVPSKKESVQWQT